MSSRLNKILGTAPFIILGFVGLLLLCSCSTEKPPTPGEELPEIRMTRYAGNGDVLFATVDLKSAKKLPCLLDTGTPYTWFDKSLEPKLGRRIGPYEFWALGSNQLGHVYDAPGIYMGGNILMKSDPYIITGDLRPASIGARHRIMCILGIDVLSQYCIQLDFKARKIRFLDDEHLNTNDLGRPFPLKVNYDGTFYIGENLLGTKESGSIIDIGNAYDGWLIPELLQCWNDHVSGITNNEAHSPDAILAGDVYHQVHLYLANSANTNLSLNGIGLHFMSRHLVTLDFPNGAMYLKRTDK
jgi:hypothetical protein